jgi:hypothetical protein
VPAGIALVTVAALGLAACASQVSGLKESLEGGFQKPATLFRTPDWARASTASADLGPKGPVPPEDLVSPAGECAPAPAETATRAAAAPASPAPAAPRGTGFEGGR